MRDNSERPEGVKAGNTVVAGTDEGAIFDEVSALLTSEKTYRERARVALPYGDGHSARKIVR